MKLSPHFTLAELTITHTGLNNSPGQIELENLRRLAATLEQARDILGGKPITINSAYRAPRVNSAVGGSPTSAHMVGLAADLVCPAFGSPLEVCRALSAGGLIFDQLIHEYGRWVHLGIGPRNRQQLLTIDRMGARTGLHEVRP